MLGLDLLLGIFVQCLGALLGLFACIGLVVTLRDWWRYGRRPYQATRLKTRASS